MTRIILKNKRLYILLSVAVFLLLIPLVAMQLTTEVNWTLSDFLIAAILLIGTAFICDLVLRKVKTTKIQIGICVILVVLLFLIWAELAVGVFGTPFAGN